MKFNLPVELNLVIVSTSYRDGRLAQTVQADSHPIHVDVLAELGGDNSVPNPHNLFDAALAACTATTVLMQTQR
jgi:putative redox protein